MPIWATKMVTLENGLVVGESVPGTLGIVNAKDPKAIEHGIRLTWSKLLREDGQPHTSAMWVLRRFKTLEKHGWVVYNREQFIQYHLKK